MINGSNCRAMDAANELARLGIQGYARNNFMLNTQTIREVLKLTGSNLRKRIMMATGIMTPKQLQTRNDYNKMVSEQFIVELRGMDKRI